MRSWQMVRMFGGLFVLVSLALACPAARFFVNQNWLWFTAFVGAIYCKAHSHGACWKRFCVSWRARRLLKPDYSVVRKHQYAESEQ